MGEAVMEVETVELGYRNLRALALLDADSRRPILTVEEVGTSRRRWQASRGGVVSRSKRLFVAVDKAQVWEMGILVHVFVEGNSCDDPDCGYHKGTMTISRGGGRKDVARIGKEARSISSVMKGEYTYHVNIIPDVDQAFVLALTMILDQRHNYEFERMPAGDGWKKWIQAAPASISFGFHGLGQLIHGCFDSLVAALGSAAHALAVPFEAVWQWLQAAAAGVSSGFDVFWEHMQGIFAGVPAALASAAHSLVLPLESFWRWVHNSIAGISLDLDGFWPLVQRFVDTAASKAHELVPALEAFWRWLKDAAVVALPYVLAIAAVVCVAAVAWYCWQILCTAAVQVAKALVQVLSSCWGWLYGVAMLVGPCCGHVTMAAPGVAGGLMSRVAFETAPRLFFQISRSAGGPVATAVFSTPTIASAVAAPVAALFGG
ncbi:unnamed protein product [Triticum turgidum subsp. durum]|uniref:Uncharacterized protein n=1 Tax=Triticum turgidum subsp. durum TaxID=4567 RepID=A0A9R0U4E5_TRITD|nr:unnamed protein product [Triticum turgidum subsp. durum]